MNQGIDNNNNNSHHVPPVRTTMPSVDMLTDQLALLKRHETWLSDSINNLSTFGQMYKGVQETPIAFQEQYFNLLNQELLIHR